MQPQLPGAHARLSVHAPSIHNHAMGGHQPNRHSTMPNSIPRVIPVRYLTPALPHSLDGQIKRRQRFVPVKSGSILFLHPWLIVHTRSGDSRQRDATQEAREEAKLERASACRRAGGVNVAARNRVAEL